MVLALNHSPRPKDAAARPRSGKLTPTVERACHCATVTAKDRHRPQPRIALPDSKPRSWAYSGRTSAAFTISAMFATSARIASANSVGEFATRSRLNAVMYFAVNSGRFRIAVASR